MITIQPQYDVATRSWFAPGLEFEAPTLRELQRQMGEGVRLEGYYPCGFGETLRVTWLENEARRRRAKVKAAPPVATTRLVATRPGRRVDDCEFRINKPWSAEDDKILEKMWGTGSTAIAKHLGRTRNSVIGRAHRLGLAKL